MHSSPDWRAALAGLLVVALAGCGRGPSGRTQGYVEGEFVHAASPMSGRLEELAVCRGEGVGKGAVLFRLEETPERAAREEALRRVEQARAQLLDARQGLRPSEIAALEAQLEQAKSALVLSEVELERQTKLLKTQVSSRRDVDMAQATRDADRQRVSELQAMLETGRLGAREELVHAAEQNLLAQQAALERAEWNLGQKTQSAGEAALVSDTLYREGDWVSAGSPVVVLLPPGNVKVRAFVAQGDIGKLKVGDAARVHVDGVAEPYPATLTFISPRAEFTPPVIYSQEMREKFVFMVELSVDPAVAQRLHPGQPVDVDFPSL